MESLRATSRTPASAHSLAKILRGRPPQSTTIVYSIGIFDNEYPDRNPDVLKRLAQASGGEALFPGRRDAIVAACERIVQGIRNQHPLGYGSDGAVQPGVYWAVRVVAKTTRKSKLIVLTRSGYMAGVESVTAKDAGVR